MLYNVGFIHRRSQSFDLGGGGVTTHMQSRYHPIAKEKLFMWQRYRRMEDQKPWIGLALQQNLEKGNGLNQ